MAKAQIAGRVASYSTNRYWVLQNEYDSVWNGLGWVRQTSEDAKSVIGFKSKKLADAFRKHIQRNRTHGDVMVCRASYTLQIKIKTRPIDTVLLAKVQGE